MSSPLEFPYKAHIARIERYRFNDKLFKGDQFDAFKLRVQNEHYNRDYSMLKYVVANFAGLISKVAADMLAGETNRYMVPEGDQDFMDALIQDNNIHTQLYESALANSRHGDAVFKLRVGKRHETDENATVIIEDITPSIYFPDIDPNNVRDVPDKQELAWKVVIGKEEYVRKEIHEPGKITNELWLLKDGKINQKADLKLLNDPGLEEVVETEVNDILLFHIPNWKDGSEYFGYDDYQDLISLFYAVNNRLTKTENILDKHSDPILALPEGVLDEQGNVKKEAFTMFEIPSQDVGSTAKPEYIVWNASLESSFSQVEKLVNMIYMFSETSPDAFGMGNNPTDSGRALKLRLMRTIAKVNRKRLYYDAVLKKMLYVAQELAKAHNVGVGPDNHKLSGEPAEVKIDWQDGVPIDSYEASQEEELRITSGTTSKKQAIMRLDKVDEETAEDTLAEIAEEDAISMPTGGSVNPPNTKEPDEANSNKPDVSEPATPGAK